MRGTPPVQRRPVTNALRASVVEDLPEINDIVDAELRAKAPKQSTRSRSARLTRRGEPWNKRWIA